MLTCAPFSVLISLLMPPPECIYHNINSRDTSLASAHSRLVTDILNIAPQFLKVNYQKVNFEVQKCVKRKKLTCAPFSMLITLSIPPPDCMVHNIKRRDTSLASVDIRSLINIRNTSPQILKFRTVNYMHLQP